MTRCPIVALSLLAAVPSAQAPYLPTVLPGLPEPAGHATEAVLGDFGGSPEADVLVRTDGGLELMVTEQALVYSPAPPPAPGIDLGGIGPLAIGDVDRDGHLDAVVGREGGDPTGTGKGSSVVLFGDGTGTFSEGPSLPNDHLLGDPARDVILADLDADGDLDVVHCSWDKVRAHLAGPAGSFDVTGHLSYTSPDDWPGLLESMDYEQDGDRDVVVTRGLDPAVLLVQEGGLTSSVVGLGHHAYRVAPGDVDGDGDEDLVLSRSHWDDHRVLLDQAGTFAVSQFLVYDDSPVVVDSELLDVDGDGDLDVVNVHSGYFPHVYENLTGGTFSTQPSSDAFPTTLRVSAMPMADLDGDGDLDGAAISNTFGSALVLGDGAGRFEDFSRIAPIQLLSPGAVADLDGNGYADVYSPSRTPHASLRYLNDGFGGLAEVPSSQGPFAGDPLAVDLADLDGDGDLDAYVAMASMGAPPFGLPEPGPNELALGDGTGDFVTAGAPASPTEDYPSEVHLFDADGDGDRDALLVCSDLDFETERNRLELNDGSAGFADAPGLLPAAPGASRSAAIADFDADGDLDLLLGEALPHIFATSTPAQPLYFENTGAGLYVDRTADRLPAFTVGPVRFLAGDLDLDGDVDAYLVGKTASTPSGGDQGDAVLLGDGTGALVLAPGALPSQSGDPYAGILADVDEDGDPDVVRATADGNTPSVLGLYVNDGGASFVDAGSVFAAPFTAGAGQLAAVDVDGDADVDLLTSARVFHSARRELVALTPASLGKELVMELRSASLPGSFLLAYGAGLDSLDLGPLGVLRLDFTQPFAVAAGGVLDAQGAKRVTLPVPGSPSLSGTTLYWQALVGGPPRMTRALPTRFGTL